MSDTTPLEGRDVGGRFAAGNAGGPGNPHADRVAFVRTTLLDCVTAEDVQDIYRALVEQAKEGNVAAARLLLGYLLGKPGAAPDLAPEPAHAAPSTNGHSPAASQVEELLRAGIYGPLPSPNGVLGARDPFVSEVWAAGKPSPNGKKDRPKG